MIEVTSNVKYGSCLACGTKEHLFDFKLYRLGASIKQCICLCYECVHAMHNAMLMELNNDTYKTHT